MDKTKKQIKKAAALKYDEGTNQVPKVLASGSGKLAEKILELAKTENIAVYKDQALVEALVSLEIGQQIPQELYKAVAEILAFIYSLDLSEPIE